MAVLTVGKTSKYSAYQRRLLTQTLSRSLNVLRERYQKQHPGKIFPEPKDYDTCRTSRYPDVAVVSFHRNPRDPHPWVSTPALLGMEHRFAPWLWDKCHRHLDHGIDPEYASITSRERTRRMTLALEHLPEYPLRPPSPLPSSYSVDKLRKVLDAAPSVDWDEPVQGEGIETYTNYDTEETYYWCDRYLRKLFRALVRVIEEHGLDGWTAVRWEVYDKVVYIHRF